MCAQRSEPDSSGYVWTCSLNSDPDVIDNVRPMTNEWIMIPTCRTYPCG